MLVDSIDPLAPYKVSDDLILELVNVTALIRNDPEGVAAATCWIEIVEPHNLAKHQSRDRDVSLMTINEIAGDLRVALANCVKRAGSRIRRVHGYRFSILTVSGVLTNT
jgi:hypothetical protein